MRTDLEPLPMTPARFLATAVDGAMRHLPLALDSDRARCMLVAIALQESGLAARVQGGHGPARGLMQFERGGVLAVLNNRRTHRLALDLCYELLVDPTSDDVLAALQFDDVLAAAFGRLLLWADPGALPRLGDAENAWAVYLRCWRPGKPRPKDWAGNYKAALAAVKKP